MCTSGAPLLLLFFFAASLSCDSLIFSFQCSRAKERRAAEKKNCTNTIADMNLIMGSKKKKKDGRERILIELWIKILIIIL